MLHFRPDGGDVGPARSAVEIASDAARAAIASNGTAMSADATAEAERVAAERARATDGTYAPKLPAEIEAENVAKAAKAEAERIAAEKASEGKTPEQLAAEKKAADEARTPEQIAAAEQAAERTVEVELDGEKLPVEFDDPKIAEHVRDRFEVAAQAEQTIERAQKMVDDVLMVRESVNVDPVGFVIGQIGKQPEAIEHLVLSLLTQESAAALLAKVAKIAADPNELRVVRSEQKAARSEYREQASERIAEARAVDLNLRDIQAACSALLPRDITPERQRVLYADMMRDIHQYATRHELMTVDVNDLPIVLRARLTANGVDPVAATQQITEAVTRRRSGKPAPRAGSSKTVVVVAKPAAAKTGTDFVAANERRRAISIPGGGAGSPGTGAADVVVPLNADGSKKSIAQTVEWHREQRKLGKQMLVPVTS